MEPRIQYAKTSDGVSIAYWAIGSGEPYVITYSPGTGHAQLEWEIPEAKAAYLRLAERRTVVRLDWRNNGLSTRGVRDLSLEAHLIGHVRSRLRQQRQLRLQEIRRLQCVMRDEPANDNRAVVFPDIGQARKAVDIDQVLRLGEAQLHDRDQAVPAGEELRLVAVLR